MGDLTVSDAAVLNLNICGIILAALCGLFGVYTVLFFLGVWSTMRHKTTAARRLRTITVVLYVSLLIHFITRALQFARSRNLTPPDNEMYRWSIPLVVVGNVTTTFAGLCSDGLLAWRFYVIFERRWWAKWIPGAFVVINALLCWSADAQHLAVYHHRELYENVLLDVTLKITVAWGWLMFAINTTLIGLIIWRILSVTRGVDSPKTGLSTSVVIRALIESASVTWVGLLVYEIASLAPTGGITTNLDVGYVMASILPVFFGISQTLITFRLGLTKELSKPVQSTSGTSGTGSTAVRLTMPSSRRTGETGSGSTFLHIGKETPVQSQKFGSAEDLELGALHSHEKE